MHTIPTCAAPFRRGLPQRRRPGLAIALAAVATLAAAQSPLTKGPYLQTFAPGQMSVMWETTNALPAVVRFGPGTRLESEVVAPPPILLRSLSGNSTATAKQPARTNEFYVHEAVLPNLRPGTTYSYRVESAGWRSERYTFKNLDPAADRLRFAVYGDTRSQPQVHAKVARRLAAARPELILHTGDLVAVGDDYALWQREYFGPLADVISRIPMLSVLGNHERDGTNYLAYFHLPDAERWYAYDAGPVHVLALDFHFASPTNAQYQFAERDLTSSRAPWKLVILHEPMFNIGGHASSWGRDHYLPLFHRTGVDVVLTGHSHLYERFRPLGPGGPAAPWVIQHITAGGGGANLYQSLDHPALVAHATTNHFVLFDATPDTLRGEVITVHGQRIDAFTLHKPAGQQPATFRAQAYPEELMRFFTERAPSLAGRANAIPTRTHAARVQLTLAPRRRGPEPMALSLELTPQSARAYLLDHAPVRVMEPAPGASNLVVNLSVRARAWPRLSTNKNGELVPPLLFQASGQSTLGPVRTYGGKAKVVPAN